MFFDDLPNFLPFRTVALQTLFIFMSVAIEAAAFQRHLKLDPSESVYFAAALNLFCVVVGWLAFFILFNVLSVLPGNGLAPLINFIFFDNWSSETATALILSCFVIFFASIAIKELGLLGMRYLILADAPKLKSVEPAPSTTPDDATPANNNIPVFVRTERPERTELRAELRAILFANAWSYSAILVALLVRQAFL
ncbi:hypothetical protein IFO70_14495 [Phormidium tenue FACHB-886]|nr:hypothetical protein [Phormidium tenue FACHB-886]